MSLDRSTPLSCVFCLKILSVAVWSVLGAQTTLVGAAEPNYPYDDFKIDHCMEPFWLPLGAYKSKSDFKKETKPGDSQMKYAYSKKEHSFREKSIKRSESKADAEAYALSALKQAKDSGHYFVTDTLAIEWLRSLDLERFVSMPLGDIPKSRDTKKATEIRLDQLVEFVLESGFHLLYDADTSSASYIQKKYPEGAIGITKDPAQPLWNAKTKVLRITNPFLRLSAFSEPREVVAVSDSQVGLALVLQGSAKYYVPSVNGPESLSLRDWKPEPGEPRLGMTMPPILPFALPVRKKKTLSIPFPPKDILDHQSRIFSLTDLVIEAKDYADHQKSLESHLQKEGYGVTFFGSSQYPGFYTPNIIMISEFLAARGLAISTGGGGGVMEIANQSAQLRGSLSVGIPLSGRMLKAEREQTQLHSLTVRTASYASRIPLLLYNKKIILIAPGGSGTQQEIATTLLSMHENDDISLVFIGERYYGNLVKGFHSFLSEKLLNRIYLLNDEEQMRGLLNDIELRLKKRRALGHLRKSRS